jgi:photosystem II stability/assembly factor-like uncharacterized protein
MKHRVLVGVLLALAPVLIPSATSANSPRATPPPGSITQQGWSLIPKGAAGLGASTSFNALASNGDALLLAGSRPIAGNRWRAAIWRSRDGFHWTESKLPMTVGAIGAIGFDGDTALATGGTAIGGESDFVWRSDDGGRTWATVASGNGLFGTPAPQMGRPSVNGLIRHRGWWVASGGRSDGYAAIWVSRDGARWRQVLGSNSAGSASVVRGRDGALLAYWVTTAWFTHDPAKWGAPEAVSVPGRFYVSSVARGATMAVGENVDRHGLPTPLLRSADGGRTWREDEQFLETFADASVRAVEHAGVLWVAAGTSGAPNHVDAWVSSDRRTWQPMPAELYGGPGGTLSLVAALDGRIVLVGTAPELDRYYTWTGTFA